MPRRFSLLLLPLLLPATGWGTTDLPTGYQYGVSIYLDEDFFIPGKNEDRDYTLGIAVEFSENKETEPPLSALHQTVDSLSIYADAGWGRLARSWMIGTVAYTPDDLSEPQPIFDDRPYSSLLYFSTKRVFSRTGSYLDGAPCRSRGEACEVIGTELQLGILGLPLAEAVQTGVHELLTSLGEDFASDAPKGWNHQISDGGEPTFRYRVAWSRLMGEGEHWDLAGTADANIGYQTNAGIGLSGRLGKIDSGFWTLPFQPVNRGNFVPAKGGKDLYLWGAYHARLIGYDALLQGQFRESDVTFSPDRIERLVHEAGTGVTWDTEHSQWTLAVNYKSAELRPPTDNSHYWAGFYVIRALD